MMTGSSWKVWIFILIGCSSRLAASSKKVHIVHWNKNNPIFRIDNTDNVIDVNVGNTQWEYDQANFICPSEEEDEKYIIYNVSKEEYDSCMVTNPSSRVVATCTDPSQLLYFTITFRSFTPTPGGLEFHPGRDYYFITTSRPDDLHRKNGGRCSTHNMKVIFKVAENNEIHHKVNEPRTTGKPEMPPPSSMMFDEKNKYYPVVESAQGLDENTLESAKKVVRDFQSKQRKFENEVIKQEASRMHYSASSLGSEANTFLLLLLSVFYCNNFL